MGKPLLIAAIGLALNQFSFCQGIPNYPAADLVLGQKDFISNASPWISAGGFQPPTPSSLSVPVGIAVDPSSGKVFVSDMGDHRVLRYADEASLRNGQPAEAVFGQSGFKTRALSSGGRGMNSPRGICIDSHGRLWVADSENNRVLGYEDANNRESGAAADHVFGQKNLSGVTHGLSASRMTIPMAVCVDASDRLWVADSGNSRVLRFDAITKKANGADADGVLLHSDFDSRGEGGGRDFPYRNPISLCVSPTGSLFVADMNRVWRFDHAASLENGALPQVVLGAPNFSSAIGGSTTQTTMSPISVSISPDDTLWVGDRIGIRVLRFKDASTLANGAPADGVVGQPNFTRHTGYLSSRGLGGYVNGTIFAYPVSGCFADANGSLWAVDNVNCRVLRYSEDDAAPKLTVSTRIPVTPVSGNFLIRGTASDASGIARVIYTINSGVTKQAEGTKSWKAPLLLKSGLNTVRFYAVDAAGNRSRPVVVEVPVAGKP